MKTVIENELKNNRHCLSKDSTKSSSSSDSKHKDLSSCSYKSRSEFNDDDSRSSCSQSLGGESITSCESFNYKPHVSSANKKTRNKKQNYSICSVVKNNIQITIYILKSDIMNGTARVKLKLIQFGAKIIHNVLHFIVNPNKSLFVFIFKYIEQLAILYKFLMKNNQ